MADSEEQTAPAVEQTAQPDLATDKNPEAIEWTASEFVHHDKSAGWYAALGLVAILGAALVYLISRDAVSVAVVIVAAALLGYYGTHQPRQIEYHLDGQGLQVGTKHYTYGEFRSFAVVPEHAFASIVFMPLKRFAVPVTIYFSPDDEDKILNLLSDRLPFEQPPRDAVGSLMRRIRF
jgi:uncharacterized membrane protein